MGLHCITKGDFFKNLILFIINLETLKGELFMRYTTIFLCILCCVLSLAGCNNKKGQNVSNIDSSVQNNGEKKMQNNETKTDTKQNMYYTVNSKVTDVINDPIFGDYGRLLFPVHMSISSTLTLGNVKEILPWYSEIDPNKTVEIVNEMRQSASNGKTIFYDIYSEKEKKTDPEKANTGLFFFRGNQNKKTAIVNAGGGFMYVAGIHDSFPQALALSKKGYNAFALIYRPGAQTACEDLARAIAFLHENADKLKIDMKDYSLWGGSAGARMAAWLGSYGTSAFGEKKYPPPAAVIMQYTGLSEVNGMEPPTYACVGNQDGIAPYRNMKQYIRRIKQNGTDAQIEVFDGLSHGFGLGEHTVAKDWLNHAINFWERNMRKAN